MEQSTHYELNLMEGSDTFNPLTIDRPNFERIDEIMHDNAIKGVTRADHTKSASVHEIVRENSDAPVIRFIATADFSANDTFTVDEVQVSAFNTAGEPLGSGAFKTGASVLCILVGTTLTVLTNGVVANADNANKLDGEEASYYGKQSDVTALQTLANGTQIIAQANQTAINNARAVTLWTNPNPGASFAGQTIQLSGNLNDFDYIAIDTRVATGSRNYKRYLVPLIDLHVIEHWATASTFLIRPISAMGGTSITFADAETVFNNVGSVTNDKLIPVKILGYKSF